MGEDGLSVEWLEGEVIAGEYILAERKAAGLDENGDPIETE